MSSHHTLNNTEYWVYSDEKDLPVIIMIHGLRGTHHGLDLISKRLSGNKIIVPDLPGFGISKPLKDEHSIDNYVVWLKEFISDLKLKRPPVLLGHSFGSIITASYAEKYPDSISKLILVNPIGSPALSGSKILTTKLAVFYYWLGKKLPNKIGTKLLAAKPFVMIMSIVLTKTKDKKTRNFIHDQHLQHFSSYANRQVVDEAFKASINNNVSGYAKFIKIPTLIIAGDIDDITPLKDQIKLSKMFTNAKIEVISGVGHLTHYETPDQVVAPIVKFIS